MRLLRSVFRFCLQKEVSRHPVFIGFGFVGAAIVSAVIGICFHVTRGDAATVFWADNYQIRELCPMPVAGWEDVVVFNPTPKHRNDSPFFSTSDSAHIYFVVPYFDYLPRPKGDWPAYCFDFFSCPHLRWGDSSSTMFTAHKTRRAGV